MDTLRTGAPFKNVPAFQSIDTPSGKQILKFHVSTERVGGEVLLRIDRVGDNTSA
jgi:hypothetical protein